MGLLRASSGGRSRPTTVQLPPGARACLVKEVVAKIMTANDTKTIQSIAPNTLGVPQETDPGDDIPYTMV